jgi:hypothetical protein
MDRGIIYSGQIPLDTDLLFAQKASMVGLAKLAAAMFGTSNAVVNGLSVGPNSPAALNVVVQPGEIYQLANIDGTAYGSIAADTSHNILKQGVSLDATTLSCAAPGTAGFSINYLIQATFSEVDATSVVLPYYNSSNPAQAYSGPSNSGSAQYTRRTGTVVLSAKAGTAATTGTQITPSPDSGYVGLAVVTVANGQSTIVAGNISIYQQAPYLPSSGLVTGGIQQAGPIISAAGGTADALTGSYFPAITAITNGMTLYVRASSANATTTPTFTPNSGVITAKTIVKGAGSAVAAGDIAGGGHWIELQYDATLDKWVLLNPANGITSSVLPIASVRHTVLSGVVSSGVAAFLAIGTGLAVNLLATATPLVVTTANGFNASGAVDSVTRVAADIASAWSSLTASSTLYLYIDSTSTASPTYGFSALQPVYQYTAPSSPATDQHWFDRSSFQMKRYNGSAWIVVPRVFVGEAVTGSSTVSSVTTYAFRGEYVSQETSLVAGGTQISWNHNLGVQPETQSVVIVNRTSELGYSLGDEVPVSYLTNSANTTSNAQAASRLAQTLLIYTASPYLVQKASATLSAITLASWKAKAIIKRGW